MRDDRDTHVGVRMERGFGDGEDIRRGKGDERGFAHVEGRRLSRGLKRQILRISPSNRFPHVRAEQERTDSDQRERRRGDDQRPY